MRNRREGLVTFGAGDGCVLPGERKMGPGMIEALDGYPCGCRMTGLTDCAGGRCMAIGMTADALSAEPEICRSR